MSEPISTIEATERPDQFVAKSETNTLQSTREAYYGDENHRFTAFKAKTYDSLKTQIISIRNSLISGNELLDFDAEKNALQSGDRTPGFPRREDKEGLLMEILETAQNAKTLQEAAIIMGAGILLVHPLKDGNGRVSRTVYAELSRGEKLPDKMKEAIQLEGNRDVIDLGPGIDMMENVVNFTVYQRANLPQEEYLMPWHISYNQPGRERELFNEAVADLEPEMQIDLDSTVGKGSDDEYTMNIEACRYALTKYNLDKQIPENLLKQYKSNRIGVDVNGLLASMSKGDKEKFVEDLWEYRREKVQALLGLLAGKDGFPKYIRDEQGTLITPMDFFVNQSTNFMASKTRGKERTIREQYDRQN
jgi:hypothetical protein